MRNLKLKTIEFINKFSVCVIIASGGYPGIYKKGKSVLGVNNYFKDNVHIFHSGTKLELHHCT